MSKTLQLFQPLENVQKITVILKIEKELKMLLKINISVIAALIV